MASHAFRNLRWIRDCRDLYIRTGAPAYAQSNFLPLFSVFILFFGLLFHAFRPKQMSANAPGRTACRITPTFCFIFHFFFSTILFYFICFFLCGRFSGSVPTWSFFSVFYPLWCMCVFSWCCECGSSCGCKVCIQVFSCVLISWSNMFFHKIKLILISKLSK